MRLTVFGAGVDAGVELARHALDAGHEVTAVVPDPGRLAVPPDELLSASGRLSVESADVTDPEALVGTLEEADAAVSMLRHRLGGSASILTQGIHAILAAMEKAEARRLVAVSSGGLFGQADAHRMEELISESPADWTILRPHRRLRTPLNTPLESPLPASAPRREDLAGAILRALDDPATIGHRVSV